MANWPYSTQRWQRLRLVQLAANACCAYCERRGIVTPATLVDHIVRVVDDPDRIFDQDNLQSLCVPCHNSEKRREESDARRKSGGDQSRGCGVDGIPNRGWE